MRATLRRGLVGGGESAGVAVRGRLATHSRVSARGGLRTSRTLLARSLARTETPARRSRKNGARASGIAIEARVELGDAPHAKNAAAVAKLERVV